MMRNNNEGTAENAENDEAAKKRRKAKTGLDGTEWKVCAGHTGKDWEEIRMFWDYQII